MNASTPASGTAARADVSAGPKSDQDPKHPVFRIETSKGAFDVRLDEDKAPITVDNFRNYVERGFYSGTIFHQIIKSPLQLVVAGGFTPDLAEKKGLVPIRSEAYNGLKNRRGTIAMARGDNENSATSQYFINLADNTALDFKARTPQGYGYCVFGEVVSGLDVVDSIAQSSVHDVSASKLTGVPNEAVVIRTVKQIK